jgi:hypothetical protein
MKIFSWKIWIPTMVVCMVGFGLTGPAVKQQAKEKTQIEIPEKEFKFQPKFKGGHGKGGAMAELDIEIPRRKLTPPQPPPPPPPPAPKQSSAVSDILFYGSIMSAGVNAISFSKSIFKGLLKLINLIRRKP